MQKQNPLNIIRSIVALTGGLGIPAAQAMDFHIAPRVNMGFFHYELNYDAYSPTPGASSVGRFSIDTDMPNVSGGFTAFFDRFFIDFSSNYAFNGSATSTLIATTPAGNFGGPSQATTNATFLSDIDRLEYAFSVGFQATPNWVLYAGYRNTETSFAQSINGTVATTNLATNQPVQPASGNVITSADLSFDYDGPFVGTGYSWDFSEGPVPGRLSGNVALAFMEGTSTSVFGPVRFNGIPITVNQIKALRADLAGDTVGISLGLNWRGVTPISGLSYLLGASGYRYEFNNSQSTGAGFDETIIRFDAGLSYAF